MLKVFTQVTVPVFHAAVIAGPEPTDISSFLNRIREGVTQGEGDGVFEFHVMFPSVTCGGETRLPVILPIKVRINGNSMVDKKISLLEGFLLAIGNYTYSPRAVGPLVRMTCLAAHDAGAARVGEVVFDDTDVSSLVSLEQRSRFRDQTTTVCEA